MNEKKTRKTKRRTYDDWARHPWEPENLPGSYTVLPPPADPEDLAELDRLKEEIRESLGEAFHALVRAGRKLWIAQKLSLSVNDVDYDKFLAEDIKITPDLAANLTLVRFKVAKKLLEKVPPDVLWGLDWDVLDALCLTHEWEIEEAIANGTIESHIAALVQERAKQRTRNRK
jgi:hypothetical protein